MIIVIMQKILEKHPLHSLVVKNANVFDPKSIITVPAESLRRNMKSLLRHIVSLKIISTSIPERAERALSQCSDLISTQLQLDADKFKSFNSGKERLDDFFFQVVSFTVPADLKSILKLVLVLSHGQASIERGFNVNKTILKVNMNEKSQVARKIIIDHMQKNNHDPASITITKNLVMSVKAAHQKYQDAIEEEKKNEKEKEQNDQLTISNTEIRDVEKKKECLSQLCESLDKEFIEIIQSVIGKYDTTVHTSVIKANGLK